MLYYLAVRAYIGKCAFLNLSLATLAQASIFPAYQLHRFRSLEMANVDPFGCPPTVFGSSISINYS
jgi:hypothetical protein